MNETCYRAKNHPRGLFAIDLMHNPAGHGEAARKFIWSNYLNSTPWGQQIVLDVRSFYLAWLNDKNRNGFWIRHNDVSSGTLGVLGTG
jgi:hypothetical protein